MTEEVKLVLRHRFDKNAAVDFVSESNLDNWLKSVAIAKIQEDTMPNDPRALAKLICEYIDLGFQGAKSRDDIKQICAYCKSGFALKSVMFSDDVGYMLCDASCEYFKQGDPIRE